MPRARVVPLAAPPSSYAAAVERYRTGAGIAKSSALIYRISLTTWGWMLRGETAPTGPARRGATPTPFGLTAIDDPALPPVLAEPAAARADERDADTVNRELSIARKAIGWWHAQGGIEADPTTGIERRPGRGDSVPERRGAVPRRRARPGRLQGRRHRMDSLAVRHHPAPVPAHRRPRSRPAVPHRPQSSCPHPSPGHLPGDRPREAVLSSRGGDLRGEHPAAGQPPRLPRRRRQPGRVDAPPAPPRCVDTRRGRRQLDADAAGPLPPRFRRRSPVRIPAQTHRRTGRGWGRP